MTDQFTLFNPDEQLDWRAGHYLVDASSKRCCARCRRYSKGNCDLKRRVMPQDHHVWLRGTCDFFEASA